MKKLTTLFNKKKAHAAILHITRFYKPAYENCKTVFSRSAQAFVVNYVLDDFEYTSVKSVNLTTYGRYKLLKGGLLEALHTKKEYEEGHNKGNNVVAQHGNAPTAELPRANLNRYNSYINLIQSYGQRVVDYVFFSLSEFGKLIGIFASVAIVPSVIVATIVLDSATAISKIMIHHNIDFAQSLGDALKMLGQIVYDNRSLLIYLAIPAYSSFMMSNPAAFLSALTLMQAIDINASVLKQCVQILFLGAEAEFFKNVDYYYQIFIKQRPLNEDDKATSRVQILNDLITPLVLPVITWLLCLPRCNTAIIINHAQTTLKKFWYDLAMQSLLTGSIYISSKFFNKTDANNCNVNAQVENVPHVLEPVNTQQENNEPLLKGGRVQGNRQTLDLRNGPSSFLEDLTLFSNFAAEAILKRFKSDKLVTFSHRQQRIANALTATPL